MYSLEAPQGGASNEYPQHMFLWRNSENYPGISIKILLHYKSCVRDYSKTLLSQTPITHFNTVANLNSFLNPLEILPTAQQNIFRDILGEFTCFIMKMCVLCTH